jgi:hypothetical protein
MLTKLELSIIVLLAILTMIYSFQQTEHFGSYKDFRLRVKGTSNYYLYNQQYQGFLSTRDTGAYYYLGTNNSLVSKRGYATKIYDNKCLFYNTTDSNKYKIDKSSSYDSYTTDCSKSIPKNTVPLYFDTDNGVIYCNINNVKNYLSTQKKEPYYKFSPDISLALKLEQIY